MANIKDMNAVFKALDKMNEDACILGDNTLSTVDEWIDTGSFAFNAIISGRLVNGGIPDGRITGFSGPSGCGKTLIINKILANAQKKGKIPVIWDTEVAVDKESAKHCGLDVKNVKYCPVETIEDCRNQIVTFLDAVIENKMQGKFIIAIDSLGNLASTKELEDARKGKDAADMGLRAKALKSMMRTLTYRAAKARTSIIFSNHEYDNPASMFPSLVKSQAGGKGPVYLASVLVQLAMRQEKQEDTGGEMVAIANRVSGISMRGLTTKNRFVPPFLESEIYLNFKTGLDKYSGLWEMAAAFGVIKSAGPSWKLEDGSALGYKKDVNTPEMWDTKLIPLLQKKLSEHITFSANKPDAEAEVEDEDNE